MHYHLVPSEEVFARMRRFQQGLAKASLSGALVLDMINMFYLTGTIQKGVLFVPVEGESVFFVRRSLQRAKQETPLKQLKPLNRFNEIATVIKDLHYDVDRLGVDETTTSLSIKCHGTNECIN